eukprot:TRINITY_DN11023_c0_g1_i1.p2 TRINITY_DN11023_c0_g1~~TRINITY_DN11023_c0_g1_i1.p2  ORF type:complete len:137 (-),score=17.50 TRINITY_DN11023_c0_g1_i1:192-602(-)
MNIRAWDGGSLECLRILYPPHLDAVSTMTISGDGERLFSGSGDRSFKVFDLGPFECRRSKADAHAEGLTSMVVMENDFVFTGGRDGRIKVWDAQTLRCLKVIRAHKGAVTALAILGEGHEGQILSAGSDGSMKVWT